MPELMRAIATRLREFVGNRRRAPRSTARLPVAVSLLDAKSGAAMIVSGNNARRSATLEGHTRDLSASGLALILPAIRIGEHYLTNEERTLEIALQIPNEPPVMLRAVAVRYEKLESGGPETGYLIGVRLKEGSERPRFTAYLKTL